MFPSAPLRERYLSDRQRHPEERWLSEAVRETSPEGRKPQPRKELRWLSEAEAKTHPCSLRLRSGNTSQRSPTPSRRLRWLSEAVRETSPEGRKPQPHKELRWLSEAEATTPQGATLAERSRSHTPTRN